MKLSPFALKLERKFAAFILRLLDKTLSYDIRNEYPNEFKCIYMFWHRNLLLLALYRIGNPVAVMVSSSQDGELIAGPIEELGLITVRGSTTRQGSAAIRKMLKLASRYQLAITPDGPKGPSQKIQPGIIYIAYLAKIPIIPVTASASREWIFNSWDRFRLPKPFSRITVTFGEPVFITNIHDLQASLNLLQDIMLQQECR